MVRPDGPVPSNLSKFQLARAADKLYGVPAVLITLNDTVPPTPSVDSMKIPSVGVYGAEDYP